MRQIKDKIKQLLNNEYTRREWVKQQLAKINNGALILDAGCGTQQYKNYCGHLEYFAQDFGKYSLDISQSFGTSKEPYNYGKLDYTGDIWKIDEINEKFDAILCTEVFEHIPYPIETLKEFHRLLKVGGTLILTFPSNSLRHFDPYWFYSGFSDRFIEYFLPKSGFNILSITVNGNYYKWLMVEIYRTIKMDGFLSFIPLLPSFIYYYLKQRNPSEEALKTLCFGYQIVANKVEK